MTSHSIYHDLFIKAPASDIYRAITTPEELNNWWPLRSKGTPTEGSEYNFYFSDDYDWYGLVTRAVDDRSFHIKMTRADPDWDPTSFGFDLEPNEGGVQVKFSHTNWPACNNHFRRSSYCWAILLQGLKNYVEKGIIVPFEERE